MFTKSQNMRKKNGKKNGKSPLAGSSNMACCAENVSCLKQNISTSFILMYENKARIHHPLQLKSYTCYIHMVMIITELRMFHIETIEKFSLFCNKRISNCNYRRGKIQLRNKNLKIQIFVSCLLLTVYSNHNKIMYKL